MDKPLNILMLEDEPADVELAMRELQQAGIAFDLHHVVTKKDYLNALDAGGFDIILSDHTLPDYDGLTALRQAREKFPDTPFIFISGTLGEDHAVESLQQGAADYLVKGNLRRLAPAVRRALEDTRLRRERQRFETDLVAGETRFRSLAEQAPIGIMLLNAKGYPTYVNPYWCNIVGLTPAEARKAEWKDILHPEDWDWVMDHWVKVIRDGSNDFLECRYRSKDGRVSWVNAQTIAQHDAGGALTGFIVIVNDITAHKLHEDKIARLSRIHAVLSGINSAIVHIRDRQQLFDETCRIAVTQGNFRMAMIALWDAGGNRLSLAAEYGSPGAAAINSMLAGQGMDVPREPGKAGYELRTRKGVFYNDIATDQRIHNAPLLAKYGISSIVFLPLIVMEQPVGIVFMFSSITGIFTDEEQTLLKDMCANVSFALENMQKEEQINYLAYYDTLTGLPNGTLLHERLEQSLAAARYDTTRLAVVAMDIERFRDINESLGRDAGDFLLKAVAQRLLRIADDPARIARISADLFVLIIPNITGESQMAQEVNERLAAATAEPILVAGENLRIAMKSGVAIFPGDGNNAETLLRNAEAAVKESKNSGEKLVFYAKNINAYAAKRLTLENQLRQALELEQFVLHYQPKVNLQDGSVNSVEALIRWDLPGAGLIAPAEFIPIMENTGLIQEAGRWALSRALQDYAILRARFPHPPRIAVNVSALQLRKSSFVEEIHELLRKMETDDHGLDLEITESIIMRNVESNIDKLQSIRNMNIRVAIDDFGTGYSSLSYIAKLPIDVLKIDRSFIARMDQSADDKSIVASVISLAHALKLGVVAEGIETEEQLSMLRLLQCDEGQGYLFCKPLPLDELIARLRWEDGRLTLS